MQLRGKKRGATLVLVALSMTVILGFMAFAVDISQMSAYRSELQRAVDAGAHAGAIQLTKARYDSAAAVATSFTVANVVFGKPPIIDKVEYGTWNGTAFAPICAGLGCDSTTVRGANAIRISAHGAGSTFFAGILGALGFSVQAKATGWAAPASGTDCLKPITLPYTTLTMALNARLGVPLGTNLLRDLTDTDLALIRGDPHSLSLCLVQFLGSCGSSLASVTDSLRLNLPLGLFLPSLASDCVSANPLDALSVLLPPLAIVGGLLSANDDWCAVAGGSPCALKVALSENGGFLGSRIRMIGSIVIDSASDLNVSAHFSTSIDTGPIDTTGTESGLLYRPVLVQ